MDSTAQHERLLQLYSSLSDRQQAQFSRYLFLLRNKRARAERLHEMMAAGTMTLMELLARI